MRRRRSLFNDLGKQLRDEAITRVVANSGQWGIDAKKIITRECERYAGETRYFEQFSNLLRAEIGPPPNHSNALGGICNGFVLNGYFIDTTDIVHMRNPTSHARKTTVYLLVHPRDAVPLKRRKEH